MVQTDAAKLAAEISEDDPIMSSCFSEFEPLMKLRVRNEELAKCLTLFEMRPGRGICFRSHLCVRYLQALEEGLEVLPGPLVRPFRAPQRLPDPGELAVVSVLCWKQGYVPRLRNLSARAAFSAEAKRMKGFWVRASRRFEEGGRRSQREAGDQFSSDLLHLD